MNCASAAIPPLRPRALAAEARESTRLSSTAIVRDASGGFPEFARRCRVERDPGKDAITVEFFFHISCGCQGADDVAGPAQ